MVASLIMNRPTRVFARLTFTGEDKISAPLCCDLSRVASIVPANPLPSSLGGGLVGEGRRAGMQCISKDEKLSVLCNDNRTVSMPSYSDGTMLDQGQPITGPTNAVPSSPGVRDGRRGRKRAHDSRNDSEVNSKPVKLGRSGVANRAGVAAEQRGRKEMHHIDALHSENEVLKRQNQMLIQKVLAFQRILRTEGSFEYARQKVMALELESSRNRTPLVEGQ